MILKEYFEQPSYSTHFRQCVAVVHDCTPKMKYGIGFKVIGLCLENTMNEGLDRMWRKVMSHVDDEYTKYGFGAKNSNTI